MLEELLASRDFWLLLTEAVGKRLGDILPPNAAWAVTTGSTPADDEVAGVTTRTVTAWLDGLPQTAENAVSVILPYGESTPGTGELWLVLLPNNSPPGVLLKRMA